jgi:putative transposase
MIALEHPTLSMRRQCQLLGLHRSGLYYHPVAESAKNLLLMQLLDRQYTCHPEQGVRRMRLHLQDEGYTVNLKRVRRLLRQMGLEAFYPKPRLSIPDPVAARYPYLLKGLAITRPDQVWCADITYVGLPEGFAYLVAIMDWFSRYVIAWELSNSMESAFCVATLSGRGRRAASRKFTIPTRAASSPARSG